MSRSRVTGFQRLFILQSAHGITAVSGPKWSQNHTAPQFFYEDKLQSVHGITALYDTHCSKNVVSVWSAARARHNCSDYRVVLIHLLTVMGENTAQKRESWRGQTLSNVQSLKKLECESQYGTWELGKFFPHKNNTLLRSCWMAQGVNFCKPHLNNQQNFLQCWLILN